VYCIGTFVDTSTYHLSCGIYGNSHYHTSLILHIIDRHRQTATTQRTSIEVKCSVTAHSAGFPFRRVSRRATLQTEACSTGSFISHLSSFSESTGYLLRR